MPFSTPEIYLLSAVGFCATRESVWSQPNTGYAKQLDLVNDIQLDLLCDSVQIVWTVDDRWSCNGGVYDSVKIVMNKKEFQSNANPSPFNRP